eukprot:7060-Pyramimonas_sp.AAC.1
MFPAVVIAAERLGAHDYLRLLLLENSACPSHGIRPVVLLPALRTSSRCRLKKGPETWLPCSSSLLRTSIR